MKQVIAFVLSQLLSSVAFAGDTYVNGYYRSNGTYVSPHYRSAPNATKADNWTSKGNVNPYTREEGTREYYNYNNTRGYGTQNSTHHSHHSHNRY